MKKIMGAGILAVDKETGRILLGRRGLAGNEPNKWTPFGGTFEGEDQVPKTTAIREFKEETGCNCDYRISKEPFYVNDDNHLKFYTYIGIFDSQFPVKINSESRDFEWFDINHLPENMHPGLIELMENKKEELSEIIQHLTRASS